ncbi:MAG: hydroxyacid dehydrogenase [Chitinophagales bacterium]|nr:hydroxyacid dehydrogenase [Chitinophagaceae bacterium]MCB9065535.1 hydroxyacid dehydrogenase [Chitinophagales bacterium]
MSRKVLIAAPIHPILPRWLDANGYDCTVNETVTQQDAPALVKDCVGIITSTRLQLDKELIDAAPMLKWIGRMGSGMEVIDVPYATSKGINCYSSPDGNKNAVAEHALGMLLSLNKKILKSANEVKEGKWLRDENRGVELDGKTIGIIGFGNTGSALAKKLYGFDVRILAYDKYKRGYAPPYVEECKLLADIFNEADVVSFHVPLQEDTYHYFNEAFVSNMKKPFVLVNTSRGKVIDTNAMLEALESRKLTGVCLDVWEEEPIEKMSPDMRSLLEKTASMPQAIITPHIGGYSMEALYKMSKSLLDKIVSRK